MSLDPTLAPVYLIRAYTWELLKKNDPDVWKESNYGGNVPIVPLSEEPELSQYPGPHIVYGYANDGSGDLYARRRGSVTFAIYDQNFRRLTKTMNILQTAFEREDEAARDVNAYTSTKPQFLGLNFGYIRTVFVEGGTPEDNEGGNQSALITISFEYHVDYDVITNVL